MHKSYLLTTKLDTENNKSNRQKLIVALSNWKLFSDIISKSCFKNLLQQ